VSPDGGIARGRDDPLVGSQQVVGVGVEVRDPADHGGAGHEVVAVLEQPTEQVDITGIAFDEVVRGVVVVGLGNPSVLRIVVDADDLVTAAEELLDQVAADEPGRTGHQDLHERPFIFSRSCSTVRAGPNANRYQRR
jgi:hypothetical protein